jgi:ABC-type amino acid transport substrate-binding protein
MMRFVFLMLLTLAGPLQAEEDSRSPLRVGVSPDFEPVAYSVSGELQGIEIDFANKIAERIDRPLEVKTYEFEELIPALAAEEIDVIMSAMSVTEMRKEKVRFTNPYMEVGQMAIVRTEDASRFGQKNALAQNGLKIGVHKGTTGEDYVVDHLDHANVVAYESVESGLKGLRDSEVDAFIHDSITSWQLSRSFVNDNLMSLNRPLTQEYIAWAVRKDSSELQTTLNLILKDMKAEGEVSEVIQKWLPVIPMGI